MNKYEQMNRSEIPVKWARMGFFSVFLAKKIKTSKPSILILSLPRSGSSWIGEILGSASNALYLREPITQSNLALDYSQPSQIYIDPHEPKQPYQLFADMSFYSLPMFRRGIVINPKQWPLFERRFRRLVIKEVNPLACEWLLQRYQPRLIFLVRHPVAVALSYLKLSWVNINIQNMFFPHENLIGGPIGKWKDHLKSIGSNFWERHGAMQGTILRFVLESLNTYPDSKIVVYEDLCSKPLEIFHELFDFTDLSWDENVEKLVINRSAGGDRGQLYSTSRDSKNMINSWKGKISEEELYNIKNAYCAFDLPWYSSSNDW
jgi:hypothetical protein